MGTIGLSEKWEDRSIVSSGNPGNTLGLGTELQYVQYFSRRFWEMVLGGDPPEAARKGRNGAGYGVVALTQYRRAHSSKRKNQSSEAGTALLELGLLLPVFLLLLFGVMDFSRAFYAVITVANAARAGAGYGAQSAAKSSDFAGMTQAALDDAQDVKGMTVTPERFCECPDGSVTACGTGTCVAGVKPRIYVRVTTQKTFDALAPYPGIPSSLKLVGRAVMRAQ